MFPTTKTELAQAMTSAIVAATATHVMRRQIDQNTKFENDTLAVKLGTQVAGTLVAYTTKPVTDKIIGGISRRFGKSKSNGDIIDTHLVVE